MRLSFEKRPTDCETRVIGNACADRPHHATCSALKLTWICIASRQLLTSRESHRSPCVRQHSPACRKKSPNRIDEDGFAIQDRSETPTNGRSWITSILGGRMSPAESRFFTISRNSNAAARMPHCKNPQRAGLHRPCTSSAHELGLLCRFASLSRRREVRHSHCSSWLWSSNRRLLHEFSHAGVLIHQECAT